MVVGTFSLRNNLFHNIHVNLYSNNKRIDSLVVAGNQEFGFYLERNSTFLIEILKEGFVKKTLSISTDLPDEVKVRSYFTFGFQIPLVRKQESDEDKLVKYIDELPTAYIFYNDQIRKFDYSKDYSRALKEKQKNARQAAKTNK